MEVFQRNQIVISCKKTLDKKLIIRLIIVAINRYSAIYVILDNLEMIKHDCDWLIGNYGEAYRSLAYFHRVVFHLLFASRKCLCLYDVQ